MKTRKPIKVSASYEDLRIDQFLSNYLKISRSKLKKYINEEKIFINDARAKTNRKVKKDDVILYNFDIENNLERSTNQKKLN